MGGDKDTSGNRESETVYMPFFSVSSSFIHFSGQKKTKFAINFKNDILVVVKVNE